MTALSSSYHPINPGERSGIKIDVCGAYLIYNTTYIVEPPPSYPGSYGHGVDPVCVYETHS
jgi:hypothetical protein